MNDDFPDAQLFQIVVLPKWYTSISEYLSTRQFPSSMPPNERQKLVLRSRTFQLINGLYKMGPDQILRRCVLEEEIPRVLKEAHEGPARGTHGARHNCTEDTPSRTMVANYTQRRQGVGCCMQYMSVSQETIEERLHASESLSCPGTL